MAAKDPKAAEAVRKLEEYIEKYGCLAICASGQETNAVFQDPLFRALL